MYTLLRSIREPEEEELKKRKKRKSANYSRDASYLDKLLSRASGNWKEEELHKKKTKIERKGENLPPLIQSTRSLQKKNRDTYRTWASVN